MQIKEINNVVRRILSYTGTNPENDEFLNDYDYFDDVYGYLSEENALELIAESHVRSEVCQILPQVFYFSNTSTVSETVFNAIMSYERKDIQRSILIALSHCKISFYQLFIICQEKVCIEAFAALLDIYLHESVFSTFDLSILLRENAEFIHGISWDVVLANKELEKNKREIVLKYLSLN